MGGNVNISSMELDDGRHIVCGILEIQAVPYYETVSGDVKQALLSTRTLFLRMISEIHRLCPPGSTAMELLWVTEPAGHQVFQAQIHLYCIIRVMSAAFSDAIVQLEVLQKIVSSALSSHLYSVVALDFGDAGFRSILSKVNTEQVNAVVKAEKCTGSSNSVFPYYYCDMVPENNIDNFNGIIDTLSRYDGSAVSFQLLPSVFDENAGYMISEMTASLAQITGGVQIGRNNFYRDETAEQPYRVFSYYNGHAAGPLFNYNILVFGKAGVCAELTARVISILQSGATESESVDFEHINLNGEGIDLVSDIAYYPWNINMRLIYKYRNKELWNSLSGLINLFKLPYTITASEAVSFFRLLVDDKNVVGMKSNATMQIKEKLPSSVIDEDNIRLGCLTGAGLEGIRIGCPKKTFTRHALIVGMPGSGKTTFSINLLLQFYKNHIPFLVIEPTKTEYHAMIGVISDLQIFTPGNNDVSPFIINPFIPPEGVRIEQYIPSLASAFKAAFSMPSPLDIIFMKAIQTCYSAYGWKDYSRYGDPDVRIFGLYEFIRTFKKIIGLTDYGKEVKGNLMTGGVLRLLNLIEQNGNIYDTVNTVPLKDILSKPTVIELNSIDNGEQKALIIALLLINICVYTKHNHVGDGELKNILLIDEAHVLLGAKSTQNVEAMADSRGTTVKALQDMIAEIRSYGTGIIIADQSPDKVSREVVANTDIKIAFRLVHGEDRKIISDSTGMTELDSHQLSRLAVGEAYVYFSLLPSPQILFTEDVRKEQQKDYPFPDDEIIQNMIYWKANRRLLIPYRECAFCYLCRENCDFRIRSDATYYSSVAFNAYSQKVVDKNSLLKRAAMLHEPLRHYMDHSMNKEEFVRLSNCTKIKFLRKCLIEKNITLMENEYENLLKIIIV